MNKRLVYEVSNECIIIDINNCISDIRTNLDKLIEEVHLYTIYELKISPKDIVININVLIQYLKNIISEYTTTIDEQIKLITVDEYNTLNMYAKEYSDEILEIINQFEIIKTELLLAQKYYDEDNEDMLARILDKVNHLWMPSIYDITPEAPEVFIQPR